MACFALKSLRVPYTYTHDCGSAIVAIKKICPVCSAEFFTYPSIDKKNCSAKCAHEAIRREHFEKAKRPCKVCGKEFVPKHNKAPGLFCSYECCGIDRRKERVTSGEYVRLNMPDHPAASKQGYVLEHRYLMEQHIGRYLAAGEVVHHKNHITHDNRIENLELMTLSRHSSLHMTEANAAGKINGPNQRKANAKRMRKNNPCKNAQRGNHGRSLSSL